MRFTKTRLAILVILLLALALRLFNLPAESIWVDEFLAIDIAGSDLSDLIFKSTQDNNPPIYYLVLHYWIELFGSSELSIRLPSMIFGLMSIFVVYKLGELLFDTETALFSSLISALSLFHIYYSQEARNYSLMALLALLSTYFLIKVVKDRDAKHMTLYTLSTSLLILTHLSGLFIILVQNIYFFTLFIAPKKTRGVSLSDWLSMQSILGIVLFLWFSISTVSVHWEVRPTLIYLFDTFLEYSGSFTILLLFLALFVLLAISRKESIGIRKFKDMPSIEAIYLMVLLLLVPVVSMFVISQFSMSLYWTKHTLPSAFALYLLVAKGMREIGQKQVRFVFVILFIAFSLAGLWFYYTEPNKTRWADAAEHIDANAEAGDLLLFLSGCTNESRGINCNFWTPRSAMFSRYSGRNDLDVEGFWDKTPAPSRDEILSDVYGHDRVWLIVSEARDWLRIQNHYDYPELLVLETLGENYNLSSNYELFSIDYSTRQGYLGLNIYLFEKD